MATLAGEREAGDDAARTAVRKLFDDTRKRLVETGTRNRLVHVNRANSRGNVLNIVNERSDDVYAVLGGGKAMRFLALGKDKDDGGNAIKFVDASDPGFDSTRYQDAQLETRLGPDALQKKLLKIAREAQTAEEESGVNILYLALGFMTWFEDKASSLPREAVQQRIGANSVERKTRRNSREASLLAGIIVDGHGRRMSPSHAVKSSRRYRYYITHASAITDGEPAWRMPARDVEAAVVSRLTGMLRNRSTLRDLVDDVEATALATVFTRADATADRLESSTYHRRTIVASIVRHVRLLEDEIAITLDGPAVASMLGTPINDSCPLMFIAPVARVRRGQEVKLVVTDGIALDRDEQLIALLTEARAARERILAAPELTIKNIASASGQCRKRLARLLGVAYLAPDIVAAILQGRQPPALSARMLLTARLPLAWDQQKMMLGFA